MVKFLSHPSLLQRLGAWAGGVAAAACLVTMTVSGEEPGQPGAIPRISGVPDEDLQGGPPSQAPSSTGGTEIRKTRDLLPPDDAMHEPVIEGNPLFGIHSDPGGVTFPDVPLPLGPAPEEGGWNPQGALFPSGSDMLHLINPETWELDPTNAERSPAGAGRQDGHSEALVQLGLKVAPAVLTLRAWDEFGQELASGSGFFVSDTGVILTDMALVHPEISAEIDYITATTGDGTGYRVTGVWDRDTIGGTALLQSDGRGTPFLKVKSGHAFAGQESVTILAVHETRGLILADAVVSRDEHLSGEGWLIVRGQDSPGAVGSPVLDADGDVLAVIAMQLPIQDWVNFAVPIGSAVARMRDQTGEPIAFSKLKSGAGDVDLSAHRNFQRAYADLYEGRYKGAALSLLKLTKRYPRNAEAWGLLGLASAKLGAWDEALECQRRAVALDPSLDESWYQLALASLKDATGLTISPEAQESLENTVRGRPGDRFAWMLLAQSYIVAEDYENANAALQQVIKLEPDYAQAHYLLGYVRGKRGDFEMAEAAMRRCLQLESRNGKAWFYLGLLYTKTGNREEAAAAFQVVVQLEPKHPHAWLNLALVLKDQGKPTEARAAFRRHQDIDAQRKG